ncbi:tape measure protein [Pantoea agglomerans]|uniref:tape measure protein n=1 Tax=Enterobacter agglomerans TaxID=549 RepID=UPI001F3DBB38|nr:tape measure protein [Pantoea agglomerans]UIL51514.1 tape measure protein [Pantoea agglomerans]
MANERQLGNIVYEVELEVAKLLEAQREVNSRLDSMQDGMSRSSRSADRLETSLNRVGAAVAAAFTIDTARRIIEIADNMSVLQARITRLSSSAIEAEETMKSLSSIASTTGNSLADTEKLWESMTSSLKEAGATNSQILALTSTLQKIGTIGGSSAEEMSNALRQFGQSIAGGVVRAEEFNSVLEQMPELARQIATGLGLSMGQLRQRMLEGKLTAADALNAIQGRAQVVNEEFDKMPVSVERAKNSLDVAFKNVIGDLNQSIGLTQTLAGLMQTVSDNLNYYNRNAGDASRMPKLIQMQKDLNDEVKDGQRWYETDTVFQQRRGQAASQLKQVEQEIASIRAKAASDAKSNGTFNSPSTGGDDKLTQKLLQNSQRRLALSKVEGEARAKLMAQYDAEDAGWKSNDPRIKQLQDQYAQTLRNTEATKQNNSEGKRTESQTQAISERLADLKEQSELAATSTQDLSREQAILRAQQSLGKAATEDQIRQAGVYAAKTFDSAKAVRDLAQAEQGRKFAGQEVAAAKATPDALSGAVQDPNAQIDLQEQQKLAALAKYQAIDIQNAQLYEDAKTAIQQQAANARQQIAVNEANMQSQAISSIVGSVSQGFDGLANLAAGAAGKSSGAYQAMFALSKGFAVAQAALNLQLAISQAMADPTALTPAQKFANYAAIASAGASLLTSIGSISMGGAREHGGPVNASSMYRVGEGGKPEIFKASNGSQYMIPGDNGSVISNRDIGGGGGAGGGLVMNFNFDIQTTGGVDEATQKQMAQMMQTIAIRTIKDQQRPSGLLSKGR